MEPEDSGGNGARGNPFKTKLIDYHISKYYWVSRVDGWLQAVSGMTVVVLPGDR